MIESDTPTTTVGLGNFCNRKKTIAMGAAVPLNPLAPTKPIVFVR